MLKDEKLIQEFVIEAKEHVEKIEAGLLSFEQQEYDENMINAIFRSAHNIKGTAGFFGLKKIVELSHAMETVLGKLRNRRIAFTPDIVDMLLIANDELRELLHPIAESEKREITSFVQRLQTASAGDGTEEKQDRQESVNDVCVPVRVQNIAAKDPVDETYHARIAELAKKGHRIYQYICRIASGQADAERFSANMAKSIRSIGTLLTHHMRTESLLDTGHPSGQKVIFLFSTVLEKELTVMALGANIKDVEELSLSAQEAEIFQILSEARGKPAFSKEFASWEEGQKETEDSLQKVKTDLNEERIKVDVSLLNNLVNLSSEMVLARNQLLRLLEKHGELIPGLRPVLQKIDHTTTEMQEKIMRTRMQPVAILFHSIPRLVRDLAKKLGKKVTLKIEGKEVEMDKSILEGLIDPFTHLIRNALDHGIEEPARRKAAGKDPVATLTIKACHQGGRVIIDVADDGAGIDVEKVREQALQRGIVDSEQVIYMSESQMVDVVFSPGFTTVSQVSDVSGRGVGLDVVKSNIEKFGGTVEVHTVKGKGTRFRLLLPLTLAIIPSLILEAGRHNFALPQAHLQEIVRIVDGEKNGRLYWLQGQRVLRLRDKLLPMVYLTDVMGIGQISQEQNPVTRILIMKIGKKSFGIVVDKIHGQEELLVKPMPVHLKAAKIYSGVTILGDGRIAMVLDADGIANAAALTFPDEEPEKSPAVLDKQIQELQDLLLFQCSGEETFALPLSMVAKVSEIFPCHIERVGDREYYNFKKNIIQLIRPEQYLPVTSKEEAEGKMYVIIPKAGKQSFGILARRINDTVQVDALMAQEDMQAKGLLGATLVNGKIVLLIDVYEILEMSVPEDPGLLKIHRAGNTEKKVLLVEDNPFFIKLEKRYLEQAGYQVLIAHNGKEGLKVLWQQPVDVVVSDLHMPVMTGMEMIKHIRRDERIASLPVILMTASIQDAKQGNAILEAGFNSCAYKFDKADLLEKVANV